MAAQARFRYGNNVETIPYTPGSAVAAGDVVVIGNLVGISVLNIAANELGSLNVSGGVYQIIGSMPIDVGDPVFWDDAANEGTQTPTSNKFMGFAASVCTGDGELFDVLHVVSGAGVLTSGT